MPEEVVGVIAMSLISATVIIGMITRAIGQHYKRKLEFGKPSEGEDGESMQLQIDEMRDQMVQLEERLDFTERVIARSKDRNLLEQ